MPTGPAARQFDPVIHPLPPVLQPGPASMNVIIGFLKAWRGLPLASASALQAAKTASDIAIKAAEAATLAAAGTPGAPAAKAAEETLKAQQAAQMGSTITSMAAGADIHMCATPLPIPPHGPGVVIDGSPTVLINNLPACRMGDTIIEAIGPPNKIAMGCMTVIIGQSGSGGSSGGSVNVTPPSAIQYQPPQSAPDTITMPPPGTPGPSSSMPARVAAHSERSSPSGGAGSGASAPETALREAAASGAALVEPCKTCEALSEAAS